jgi:hypothetical protein
LGEGLIYFAAGIKEDLYDYEDLTAYLLYRLTSINPSCTWFLYYPQYYWSYNWLAVFLSRVPLFVALAFSALAAAPPFPDILQRPPTPSTYPPTDFLDDLATRLKAMLPGGIPNRQRAARWFVEWWREAPLRSPKSHAMGIPEWGWTFDCIWQDDLHGAGAPDSAFSHPLGPDSTSACSSDHIAPAMHSRTSCILESPSPGSVRLRAARLEDMFDRTLECYSKQIRDQEVIESQTQAKKRTRLEENLQREAKRRIRAAAKYGSRGA